jgi:hypothetical protein
MRRTTAVAVFLVAIGVAASARPRRAICAGGKESALFVYPGATRVWRGSRGESDQLSYHVRTEYPAEAVLKWVSANLGEKGWQPLYREFLDPRLPSSQILGWQMHIDSQTHQDLCDNQWHAAWEDRANNVVTYVFQYQHRCGKSAGNDLKVYAGYYPAKMARQMQKFSEQLRAKLNGK